MALLRHSFPVGQLGCNCTLLACPETREALVVDPGDEAPQILAALSERGWKAVQVVHTHAHFDHILATGDVGRATGADCSLHREDRFLYDHAADQLRLFGISHPGADPDRMATVKLRELNGGEVLPFGRHEARVIHTPGHTPGSICLFVDAATGVDATDGGRDDGQLVESGPLLFAGDTLFAGGVGRTDLWGGSWEEIERSIKGPLFALPDATRVIPGHGRETTILAEREDNPFVGKRGRRV